MLRRTRVLATIALASFMHVAADAEAAPPQRTFVASSGSDSNPCSITLPCRGFAAAVSVVSDLGEVIVLDSAGYGSFTIDKSVTVTSPAGVYAGISVFTGNDGIVIDGPGVVVTLHGLTINGQGGNTGINFLQGAELIIENCEIAHLGGSGTAGILAQAPGGKIVVRDTIVRDTAHVGIWVRQTTAGETTTLIADDVAVYNTSPFGIYAGGTGNIGVAEAYLTHVTVRGSSNIGVTADATVFPGKSLVSIANSTIVENGIGVEATGSTGTAKIVVATSVLVRNEGLAMSMIIGAILSRGDNTVHDNNAGGPQVAGVSALPPI